MLIFSSKNGKFNFQVSKFGLLSEKMEQLRENINSKMSEYCELEKAEEKANPAAPAQKKRKKKNEEN